MICYRLKNSRSGFTIVELMIAMAIASILLGAIYTVFISVQKTSTSNGVTAKVMQSLRTSIGFMESDIRMAGLDRFGTAGAGIINATATELGFTSDRDMNEKIEPMPLSDPANLLDGLQEGDFERITYFWDQTDPANKKLRQCLFIGTSTACDPIAEHITGFAFEYFDATNPLVPLAFPIPILNITSIRSIGVSITVELPAGMAAPVSRTITKRIFCRNLGM